MMPEFGDEYAFKVFFKVYAFGSVADVAREQFGCSCIRFLLCSCVWKLI